MPHKRLPRQASPTARKRAFGQQGRRRSTTGFISGGGPVSGRRSIPSARPPLRQKPGRVVPKAKPPVRRRTGQTAPPGSLTRAWRTWPGFQSFLERRRAAAKRRRK